MRYRDISLLKNINQFNNLVPRGYDVHDVNGDDDVHDVDGDDDDEDVDDEDDDGDVHDVDGDDDDGDDDDDEGDDGVSIICYLVYMLRAIFYCFSLLFSHIFPLSYL